MFISFLHDQQWEITVFLFSTIVFFISNIEFFTLHCRVFEPKYQVFEAENRVFEEGGMRIYFIDSIYIIILTSFPSKIHIPLNEHFRPGEP